MLKIRVLGSGLIPRGYGLAPRLTPFNAELRAIQAIIATPGLSVEFYNPLTKVFENLDTFNVVSMYTKFSNWHGNIETPVAKKPDVKSNTAPVQTPKVEENVEAPAAESVKEEVKEEPKSEPKNENSNNNQNQNKGNNNNQNNNKYVQKSKDDKDFTMKPMTQDNK